MRNFATTHVMKKIVFAMMVAAAGAGSARAASEADYLTAVAAAESAHKEAGRLRNQWTVTQTALNAAKKAAESGNFDSALKSAQEAEALARASIIQATSEKQRWRDMEIR
ncbi:hypothetical protein SSBR45G_58180 [Bradyrhizobium sp. SSBR45G]|uniref:hypothetical protein n=1 Tax=unclassified Bradyrhizobium TaxID=2631580 RepID=UPI002342A727|nr:MULTISPECIES: hypothetical protein [unclassified Bradyrhizobium]GLH80909.1 hypothetical protein SSBR45G_58180 [Bradyrhizobium sp. SSBR45G]GLH88381.1 hypothetical protein SSBR45R_58420 [Bradyrhizobium sp. SSBR45R]